MRQYVLDVEPEFQLPYSLDAVFDGEYWERDNNHIVWKAETYEWMEKTFGVEYQNELWTYERGRYYFQQAAYRTMFLLKWS